MLCWNSTYVSTNRCRNSSISRTDARYTCCCIIIPPCPDVGLAAKKHHWEYQVWWGQCSSSYSQSQTQSLCMAIWLATITVQTVKIMALLTRVSFCTTSFSVSTVPPAWKQATIIPVFKKGAAGARPISFTCVASKIMERITAKQIYVHLSSAQHSFVKDRSTCTNLFAAVNDWTLTVQNKKRLLSHTLTLVGRSTLRRITNCYYGFILMVFVDWFLNGSSSSSGTAHTKQRLETVYHLLPSFWAEWYKAVELGPCCFSFTLTIWQNCLNVTVSRWNYSQMM